MKILEFINKFEKDYPPATAFDGDNPGLLVGDKNDEIKAVLTTCDVDEGVVREAMEKGANLIVSHHPLMFSPISTLTDDNAESRAIRLMIQNGISLYSAHTNLDVGAGGINDLMASILGITDTSVIDVVGDNERGTYGYGRRGRLASPVTLGELMKKVIDTFGADGLRYAGNPDTVIKHIGVSTGGGARILYDAIELGCDCFITGDIKYNGFRDAVDCGMCVIDLMHYDSEQISKKWFADYINRIDASIPVSMSTANTNVVRTYTK